MFRVRVLAVGRAWWISSYIFPTPVVGVTWFGASSRRVVEIVRSVYHPRVCTHEGLLHPGLAKRRHKTKKRERVLFYIWMARIWPYASVANRGWRPEIKEWTGVVEDEERKRFLPSPCFKQGSHDCLP